MYDMYYICIICIVCITCLTCSIYIYKNIYEPKKKQFLEALIHDPPKKLSNPYWLVVDLPGPTLKKKNLLG